MKRNIFFILSLLVVVALSGCSKGKFCKCVSQDEKADVRIVNIEWGMSCKSISKMGIEKQAIPEGGKEPTFIRDMRTFACEHIKADEVDY